MNRTMAGLLAAVVLAGLGSTVSAQTPSLLPQPAPTAETSPPPAGPGTQTWGQLDATLADSVVGPLPPPQHPPEHLPGPYFEHDPLLDPAELPQPGWLAFAAVDLLNPHVRYWSNIAGPVVFPGAVPAGFVQVPGAHLSWAASPDLLLGYRLPSGFGEFTLAYRYLSSAGDATLPGPDGASSVRSRLDMTVAALDYRSEEISLWPWLDMRWWAGGQYTSLYFDSRQTTPFSPAVAGTGVLDRHVANHFRGFGPHAGLELACFLKGRCLALVGSIDGAGMLGRINQSFGETLTAAAPAECAVSGNTTTSSSQDVPVLKFQLGLRWQARPWAQLFAGFQYEHFWNAGRENIPNNTMGEVYDAGVVMQARFNY